jgi:hypothetical protein
MSRNDVVVQNEKVKLLATFLNNCGVAAIAGGIFGLFWQIIQSQDSHPTDVQTAAQLIALA